VDVVGLDVGTTIHVFFGTAIAAASASGRSMDVEVGALFFFLGLLKRKPR